MKLWLDDIRPMPDGFDIHCKTADEAIQIIRFEKISFISFDHDLGPEEAGTGYDVAKWIEEKAFMGTIKKMKWQIHSANPVGRLNIETAMSNSERFWNIEGRQNGHW